MRAFLSTFHIGFKYLWRNPLSVAVLIAFPIVLILILGSALRTYIEGTVDVDPVRIAVAAGAESRLAAYIDSDEISRFLDPVYTDAAGATAMVKNNSVVAAVFDDDGDVSVLGDPDGGLQVQIVFSIIDAYKQIGAAAAIGAARGADVYGLLELDVGVRDMPLGNRVPKAIDYYAVTMLVMILLYTGINGMELFSKGLLSDTGGRMMTAPVTRTALIGGMLAASTVTSFMQGMVTFIFSGVVYGVYWGENIPVILLTLFAIVLFSQSLCIFLTMLLRSEGMVTGATQSLFFIMTFVSKGYAKINFGELEKIFQYAPNAMAHTIIFGSIYGGNEAKSAVYLFALFALCAILSILAFICGRRRLA